MPRFPVAQSAGIEAFAKALVEEIEKTRMAWRCAGIAALDYR
jgi:hypothetical protein